MYRYIYIELPKLWTFGAKLLQPASFGHPSNCCFNDRLFQPKKNRKKIETLEFITSEVKSVYVACPFLISASSERILRQCWGVLITWVFVKKPLCFSPWQWRVTSPPNVLPSLFPSIPFLQAYLRPGSEIVSKFAALLLGRTIWRY